LPPAGQMVKYAPGRASGMVGFSKGARPKGGRLIATQ